MYRWGEDAYIKELWGIRTTNLYSVKRIEKSLNKNFMITNNND